MDLQEYTVFDVETTGLYPRRGDRIIEIGAISIRDGIVNGGFHSMVHVEKKITKGAKQIHGITDDMLVDGPVPEVVYPRFQAFIKDSVLIAHNARFDMAFLRAEFHRLGLGLANRHICTLEMSRRRYPELGDYALPTVYRYIFGAVPEGTQRHRALDDARMAAGICMEMTRDFSENSIECWSKVT
ncbi:MAG TPA: 3'-5' exonuclease [Methanoregulaceae archaeon]|nr:3'-5' exonuclease [Methanoregulaceae archaeon]